ncbi:PAS domain-containing protein [Flavobacterium sp. TMP13]|uniref:PAS domain-containing protein n=1 Tax=unclassified Flavobacterium TaxID=196869 RepID=UPI00076D4EEC|nr:PAS domain-containing protein [Flavobacterium sp. TAB 87]KVV13638.1 Blue-light-activated protein [Flavobacterium sp. TAB 87]
MNAYEDAIVAHHQSRQNSSFPIVSVEYYSDAFVSVKRSCIDNIRLKNLALKNSWQNFNYNLLDKLQQVVIIVTTPKLEIIFASNRMHQMNGYTEVEVLGQTPKMFQGKETSPLISKQIRASINAQEPFEQTVVNYKKDGSTYKCEIMGVPIFNNKGNLTHFVAFEKTV